MEGKCVIQRADEIDVVATNLVDCWIRQLEDAGYSYDEMLVVFRLAKAKAEQFNMQ